MSFSFAPTRLRFVKTVRFLNMYHGDYPLLSILACFQSNVKSYRPKMGMALKEVIDLAGDALYNVAEDMGTKNVNNWAGKSTFGFAKLGSICFLFVVVHHVAVVSVIVLWRLMKNQSAPLFFLAFARYTSTVCMMMKNGARAVENKRYIFYPPYDLLSLTDPHSSQSPDGELYYSHVKLTEDYTKVARASGLYQLQIRLGLEQSNLSCCFWILRKFVLHDQQEGYNLCYTNRAFLMRKVHQEALAL